MKEAAVIFPHQLFENHPALKYVNIIYLIETPQFFTAFNFHKHKLVLHRASMQFYKDYLEEKNFKVTYIPFNEATTAEIKKLLTKNSINKLYFCELVDQILEKELKEFSQGLQTEKLQSPSFLTSMDWARDYFKGKDRYFMAPFYKAQRKRLKILIKNGEPQGGSWSFDTENRKPYDENINIPTVRSSYKNKYVKEAKKYVIQHFQRNPGKVDDFFYPVTFTSAHTWLNNFLQDRLQLFGDYEDAFTPDNPFLFHSLLSPLLNIGLLTPHYVVNTTLDFAKKHKVAINSLEGFIRQIIGWREFVRIVYELSGRKQKRSNFFKHQKKLSPAFWNATTGILPIDTTIKRILKYAYCHHIERLMVLGNFMLLCRISPHEVYRWFMELFIDSYDWVMVPNVYGMSQYADGGLMTTKPYFSSSNYIEKMSNYKKGDWINIWDGLYWNFLKDNQNVFSKNPRMNLAIMQLQRLSKKKLNEKIRPAEKFLSSLIGE